MSVIVSTFFSFMFEDQLLLVDDKSGGLPLKSAI